MLSLEAQFEREDHEADAIVASFALTIQDVSGRGEGDLDRIGASYREHLCRVDVLEQRRDRDLPETRAHLDDLLVSRVD